LLSCLDGNGPSRVRQMSHDWLADPANAGLAYWSLNVDADDL
jgi:hypothetical protein